MKKAARKREAVAETAAEAAAPAAPAEGASRRSALAVRYGAWLAGLAALVVGFALSPQKGFESDLGTFIAWATKLANEPWRNFYSPGYFADYFPAYLYVLTGLGYVFKAFDVLGTKLAYPVLKAPAILGLAAITVLVARHARAWNGERASAGETTPSASRRMLVLCVLLWALNPALQHNAAIFGQVDSLMVLLGIGVIACARQGRLRWSLALLAAAFMMKPLSAVVVGGVILLTWVRRRETSKLRLAEALVLMLIVMFWIAAPFWFGRINEMVPYYFEQMSHYPYATVNGFNLYSALGWNWRSLTDAVPVFGTVRVAVQFCLWASMAALTVFAVTAGKIDVRKMSEGQALRLALAAAIIFHLTAPSMHERYFATVLPFFAFLFLRSPAMTAAFIVASLVLTMDQMAALDLYFGSKQALGGRSPLFVVSCLAKLGCLGAVLYDLRRVGLAQRAAAAGEPLPAPAPAASPSVLDAVAGPAPFRLSPRDVGGMTALFLVGLALGLVELGARFLPHSLLTPGRTVALMAGQASPASDPPVADGALPVTYDVLARFAPGAEVVGWSLFEDRGGTDIVVRCADNAAIDDEHTHIGMHENEYRKWHVHRFTAPCKGDVSLTLRFEKPFAKLGEVFFFDAQRQIVLPRSVCKGERCEEARTSPLFDEPGTDFMAPDYRHAAFFDEIYYVRAARELIEGQPIFEFTHPPLGKDLLAASVQLLGDVPFFWRTNGVLAGALIPVVAFLFARWLFGRRRVAYLAAAFCLLEPCRLSMSRIATIDVLVTLFTLAAYAVNYRTYVAFVREAAPEHGASYRSVWLRPSTGWAALTGLVWGLGIATKWVALYAAPVLGFTVLIAVVRTEEGGWRALAKPNFLVKTLLMAAIPILVYVAAYLPPLSTGSMQGGLGAILQNQKDMFAYHSSIVGEHPYSSRFYEWACVQRPLLMFQGLDVAPGTRVIVTALGNLALWWLVPVAVFAAAARAAVRPTAPMVFLVAAFAGQMVPWLLVTRSTFIYHFLPASVVGAVLLAAFVEAGLAARGKLLPWASAGYLGLVVFCYAFFFPLATGLTVDTRWVEAMKWFETWRF
jgi:predicted membrane-bound dolichyl-phosphate-mannose-protein mannosyltransferase